MFRFRFLPESCRYLLVNKRRDEAMQQLETVARWNDKVMPTVELEIPKEILEEKSDVGDLFYDKDITKVIIANWMSWYALINWLNYDRIFHNDTAYRLTRINESSNKHALL